MDVQKAESSKKDAAAWLPSSSLSSEKNWSYGQSPSHRHAVIHVGGMTCSNCSSAVERCMNILEDVDHCEVDLINEKAFVWYHGLQIGACSVREPQKEGSCLTVADLCDHIDDVGFAASIVEDVEIISHSDQDGGRANLYILVGGCVSDSIGDPTRPKLPGFSASIYNSPAAAASFLRLQNGVLEVSQATESQLKVSYDPARVGARKLLDAVQSSGFHAAPDLGADGMASHAGAKGFISEGLPAAVILTFCVVLVCEVLPHIDLCRKVLNYQICSGLTVMTVAVLSLASPVQIVCGRRFHIGAFHAVQTWMWDMNVLISLGTFLCFGYSVVVVILIVVCHLTGHLKCKEPPLSYFESPCLVITFVLVGKTLESWARSGASESLRELLALRPRVAHLLGTELVTSMDDDRQIGKSRSIPLQLLQIGDSLEVFRSEVVPADGVMASASGQADFDEALLTGESRPVAKRTGDFIIGGSKCLSKRVEVRVTRLGTKTMLSQITELVEKAQLSRAPVQHVADAVAHRFVPFIVALAVATWITWFLMVYYFKVVPLPSILQDRKSTWPELDRFFFVLEHGLTVLLVACPCALGLATPTAVMAATGVAAKHGILIRGGAVPLELGSKVQRLVLDKTGTLTAGRPSVSCTAIVCPTVNASKVETVAGEPPCIGGGPGWQPLLAAFRATSAVGSRSRTSLIAWLLCSSTSSPTSPSTSTSTSRSASPSPTCSSTAASTARPGDVGTLGHKHESESESDAEITKLKGNSVLLPGSEAALSRSQLRKEAESALWWAVGSAEMCSEHPLAKTLVGVAKTMVRGPLSQPESFENHTGIGISCVLPGGLKVVVASADHVLSLADCPLQLKSWAESSQADGATVVAVSVDGVPLASFALRDTLAPHARACVTELTMAGIEVWMCTGDHQKAAEIVAKECGIDFSRVVSGAMPCDKVKLIQRLQASRPSFDCDEEVMHGRGARAVVAMVGDGINDAPALAGADIGIAIGAGQNVAVDAADVVLVRTDLRDLTTFLKLADQTLRTIWLNFFWAFLFNVCALPVAAGAFWSFGVVMNPMVACCLMLGSSLFVVFSSLTLKGFSPKELQCQM